jgi:hypothetical protein
MQQPEVKGNNRRQVQDAMRSILGYRSFFDLRRGWRFNNPNLEQLGLVRIDYQDIDELAADEAEWAEAPQVLQAASTGRTCSESCALSLTSCDRGSASRRATSTEPSSTSCERLSYANLREPWGFTEDERPVPARWFVTSRPRDDVGPRRNDASTSKSSWSSAQPLTPGPRTQAQPSTWGGANPYVVHINDEQLPGAHRALLKAAESYGLVRRKTPTFGMTGWQLNGTACWKAGRPGQPKQANDNAFFRGLYRNIAGCSPTPCTSSSTSRRASTPPRSSKKTAWSAKPASASPRKTATSGVTPRTAELEWLPVLFCSPTMELGVDISSLNTVYMRNVPPTPANYAQRSGRAGRAGQPALVITYCASQSPHDQYYFRDPGAHGARPGQCADARPGQPRTGPEPHACHLAGRNRQEARQQHSRPARHENQGPCHW